MEMEDESMEMKVSGEDLIQLVLKIVVEDYEAFLN
jgi:hypothetical protein